MKYGNATHTVPQVHRQGRVIKVKVVNIMPIVNGAEDIKRLLRPAACGSRNQSCRHGSRFSVVGRSRGWCRAGLAKEREKQGRCVTLERASSQTSLCGSRPGGTPCGPAGSRRVPTADVGDGGRVSEGGARRLRQQHQRNEGRPGRGWAAGASPCGMAKRAGRGPACFTFLRASPRYIGAFAHTFILIKPSQIAVYPRIRICGWQGARGDQSINDSTSSIFYPTSSQHCFNIVRSKTGLTAFFYFRRIIVLNLSHLVFSDSITSCKEPSYHPKKTSEGPKMSLEIEVAEKQTAVASLDIILVCFEYIFTMHVDPIFMAFDA